MATYGEPNYKFPTLAQAVPNVTTGGTIMATVDLDNWRSKMRRCDWCITWHIGEIVYHDIDCSRVKADAALIRRVERYEKALAQAEHDLCHFYDEPATHDKPIFQIRREMREAFKEESDSVG